MAPLWPWRASGGGLGGKPRLDLAVASHHRDARDDVAQSATMANRHVRPPAQAPSYASLRTARRGSHVLRDTSEGGCRIGWTVPQDGTEGAAAGTVRDDTGHVAEDAPGAMRPGWLRATRERRSAQEKHR